MVTLKEKPACKLPDICTASYLIGRVVVVLKNEGKKENMRAFINEIRQKDINIDYYNVFKIASDYVDFD